jgi:hypothetical protein
MRALVGCAALLHVATAIVDLAAGRTGLGDEAPHLLVVAGWLLLRRVAQLAPHGEADAPVLGWARWRRLRLPSLWETRERATEGTHRRERGALAPRRTVDATDDGEPQRRIARGG